jgi:uncharacterized protein
MSSGEQLNINRLVLGTSPHLKRDAHTPMDWHPWGDAAFERAKVADRPVLQWIGFASCYWCHRIERESFEDPELPRAGSPPSGGYWRR